MSYKYRDIIDLPHHVSSKHPPMSAESRAAQFSPFAALTGHGAAIQETARLTTSMTQSSEDAKALLDMKLQHLLSIISSQPEITVTYFEYDSFKPGGSYRSVTGKLACVNDFRRSIVMADNLEIPIDYIVEIDSALLDFLLQ